MMNYRLIKDVYVAGEMPIGRTLKRGEILVLVEDEPLNTEAYGDVYCFEDANGYQAYIPFDELELIDTDKPVCDVCGIFEAYENGRCWDCLDG